MACAGMASWVVLGVFLFICLQLSVVESQQKIHAEHGAVASDDPRCSKIGRDFLEMGGNAIDATVATTFCEGVVRPGTSGIGGGGFIMIKQADEDPIAIDMREFAPKAAYKDMYHGHLRKKQYYIHSIAVPGQLKGVYKAWKMYGSLPWRMLILPAENYARFGFNISLNLHEMMEIVKHRILKDPGLRKVFTDGKGHLLKAGDICKNEKLAITLEQIAKHGPKAFYNGRIGHKLIHDIQSKGGIITLDDLREYKALIKEPIAITLKINETTLKLYGSPPPASGAASMFLMLNILAKYGFHNDIDKGLQAHRRVEALKHAFVVRLNLGDPDFVNITEALGDMLSPKFAAELQKTINDNETYDPTYYGGKWNPWHPGFEQGTTHYNVVDKDRNAVSVTTTINWYFGSGYLSPSTGIILNNHMDDFSIPLNCTSLNCSSFINKTCDCIPDSYFKCNSCCEVPPLSPTNYIAPHKRPLSAATPVIFMEGDEFGGAMGGSGGPRIIGANVETFLTHFVNSSNLLNSVEAPRFYDPLIPNRVRYENWTCPYNHTFLLPEVLRQGLSDRGHLLESMEGEPGVCQLIFQLQNGTLVAISDPRYGGKPAGY